MIKITYRMAISDSMLARRDLPFQFDKSRNLSFSIVFGFKTIIFNKFIINYHFLSFSIGFLSNFYHLLSDFYQISIEFYRFGTYRVNRSQTGKRHYRLPLVCQQTLRMKGRQIERKKRKPKVKKDRGTHPYGKYAITKYALPLQKPFYS